MKTESAQCAKIIKKELKMKYPNIKFSVNSSNFAGGNSVNISYNDAIPSSEIEKIINKYKDGQFDGMTDCYNYSPNPLNIPRAKYISVNRHISAENNARVKADIAKKFGIVNIEDEKEWMKIFNAWPEQVVWREVSKITF